MRAYHILIEVVVIAILLLIWKTGWDSLILTNGQWDALKQPDERALAATAIQNQAVAAMTMVSIIFVAIGALLADITKIDAAAKSHLRASATFSFGSLMLGLWIIGSLPVQVNFYNVAYDHWIALFSVAQLLVTFFAAFRIVNAMWRILG